MMVGQIGGEEHSSIFLFPMEVIDYSTFLHANLKFDLLIANLLMGHDYYMFRSI